MFQFTDITFWLKLFGFQRCEAFEDTKRENIRMSSNSFGGAELKVNDGRWEEELPF